MANNRVQQRFDRSIRDAVEETKRAEERDRAPSPELIAQREREIPAPTPTVPGKRRGWKLYLDPVTGATVYGPTP